MVAYDGNPEFANFFIRVCHSIPELTFLFPSSDISIPELHFVSRVQLSFPEFNFPFPSSPVRSRVQLSIPEDVDIRLFRRSVFLTTGESVDTQVHQCALAWAVSR